MNKIEFKIPDGYVHVRTTYDANNIVTIHFEEIAIKKIIDRMNADLSFFSIGAYYSVKSLNCETIIRRAKLIDAQVGCLTFDVNGVTHMIPLDFFTHIYIKENDTP